MRQSTVVGRALLASLAGPGRGASAALEQLVAARSLAGLPEAAAWHRIDGYVHQALRGCRNVDGEAVARLEAAYEGVVRRHLRTLGDLARVAGVLDGAALPWLVVKGPVLAELLHARPDLRSYSDLDVVVPPAAFGEAVRALEEAGCELLDRNWVLVRRQMPGELHLALPSGGMIDLHWHLLNSAELRKAFAVPMNELFERARAVSLHGTAVRTTDPVDTLLHLALHACMSGGNRLLWLKDLERSVRVDAPDWDEVIDRARRWRVDLVVATMLRKAAGVLSFDVPARVLRELSPRGSWVALSQAACRLAPPERATGRGSPDRIVSRATRHDLPSSVTELARRCASKLVHPGSRTEDRRTVGTDERNPASVLFPSGGHGDRAAFLAALRRPEVNSA